MLHAIQSRVEQAARKERQVRFWVELSLCLFFAAGLGLVLHSFKPSLNAWFAFLLPLFICVIGWALVVARGRTPLDLRHFAQKIETRYPELEGRLLTSLEFKAPAQELNYLERRVAHETVSHSRRYDWGKVVPDPKLVLAQVIGLVAIASACVMLWNLRPIAATGGAKELFPRTDVTVEPGDVQLERGSSFIVMAKFPEREVPANVELVMTRFGVSNRLALAKTLKDPVFGASVPGVESNFVYYVEYGGRRSRDFKVEVYEHPRLERSNADVVYPGYTGLQEKRIENTKRVSAVEGSHISFELLLNKPVVTAELLPKAANQAPVQLTIVSNQPIARLAELPLVTNGTYSLRLVDADGRTNKISDLFVLEALKNRTPELRMSAPKGDVRPTTLEELKFAGTVWDDFGVEAYGVAYAVAGQDLNFVELGSQVPTPEKRQFQFLLQLEELQLLPEQLVSYFVWADDVGPDGQLRRSTGDLFFAEIRPFDEIFREAMSGMEGQSGQGQPGGQGGNESGKMAEIQKQIITATWNLQRAKGFAPGTKNSNRKAPPLNDRQSTLSPGPLRETFKTSSISGARFFGQTRQEPNRRSRRASSGLSQVEDFGKDLTTVQKAQEQLLSQAEQALQATDDPRLATLLRNVINSMNRAQSALRSAEKSPERLSEAVAAEQSAYEAILKLQEHEYQVGRQQRGGQGQSGGSRQEQMQLQLEQMELSQSENRYETQKQAERPRSAEQKEDLLAMNRLQQLAQRQEDLNQQFKELQLELQQAKSEEERAEVLRRLKKLQEEQQEQLNDMDELLQRMERPENQSRMSEQRQQLEQTRNEAQRAAEAASQGSPSQALAAGTRAQRQLQDLRDQMRNDNSSQFSEDLREMRERARELSRAQEDVVNRLGQQQQPQKKNLSSAPDRDELLERLAQQRERLTNLVSQALEVSKDSETSEPLLSRGLYDTVRKFSQDSGREAQEAQTQLLNRGMMTRNLLEQLSDAKNEPGPKLMDITTEMVKQDFVPQARDAAQRARNSIENLREGIEQAAESVVGSDTEALRLAEQELQSLSEQLEREMAAGRGSTNAVDITSGGGDAPTPSSSTVAEDSRNPDENATRDAETQQAQNSEKQETGAQQSASGEPGQEGQANQQSGSLAQSGGGRSGERNQQERAGQTADNNSGEEREANQQPGRLAQGDRTQRGSQSRLSSASGGGGEGGDLSGSLGRSLDYLFTDQVSQAGPLTGDDFADWSERLRDVEQLIDAPELRNEVASARERAREMRQVFREHRKKPDWAVVKLQLINPLSEVRRGILEELARREPKQNMVPLDRDPVPSRYSDLVRRYYENLGQDTRAQK